jgi:hypothetical protein
MSQDLVLAKLDTAKIALVEARNIRDAKKVADIASAMKVYSARQKLGEEVSAHAHAILAEAMKRIGEMLKETERAKGVLCPRRQLQGCSRAEARRTSRSEQRRLLSSSGQMLVVPKKYRGGTSLLSPK